MIFISDLLCDYDFNLHFLVCYCKFSIIGFCNWVIMISISELVGDYDLKVMRQEYYINRQKTVGISSLYCHFWNIYNICTSERYWLMQKLYLLKNFFKNSSFWLGNS